MEDTQVISWEVEEEEETDRSSGSMGCNLEAVGRLHMFSSAHGPEKDFLLYVGENVIGRMPNCSVALPFPSISKQHAVIDIVAWNKAPILRDCGSLNGTQILRPPKILSPGVTHRLRDQELILFADLPCQYHRLDVCLPSASRGPLTIEETPRAQGGTHSQGLLLAEDSEEEADSVSESCTVKKLRTSSPLATVVPESDEEGPSSAVDVPGAHFAFELDSDTDEEGQRPAVGKAAAARRGFPVEAKQPGTDGIVTKLQLEKNRPLVKERDHDIRTERDAGREVVPVGVILKRSHPADEDSDTDVDEDSRPLGKPPDSHLERGQPSNFMDSDTDVEEEGIPATPAVGPLKRPIVSGVGMRGPGVPALTQLQKSQAVIDADMEQGEAQLAVSLERSQGSVVINSDTDDEDEVSAALTLAHLKESRAVIEHRDAGIKVGRAQPEFLLEQSKSSAESDNDTDVEEEKQTVIKRHTDNDGALVIAHSGRSRSLVSDSEKDAGGKRGSPGVHLERNRASPPMDRNTKLKEEVPLEPAVTHLEKYQPPMEGTSREAEGKPVKLSVRHLDKTWSPPDEGPEIDEEDTSFMASALADVRSQLPAGGDAGTQWAAAVPKRESAVEAGTQGGSPVAQVEQDHLPLSRENLTDVVVNTGTSGDLSQPHKEGSQTLTERETKPHAERTKESKDSHDDSEDLDLQATQCFVTPEENASLEGTLDESWEVLATQPFCPRESETQHEADGTCPSPPRGTPQDQHLESPVQTGSQAEGKGPSTQNETTGRVSPKREALMREAEDLPPGGEREDGMGEEELTRGLQEREHRQVCADHPQIRESDTEVESADAEEGERRVRAEMETSKEMQAEEIEEEEAPARETLKREAERPVPEGDSEPTGLEVMVPKGTLEKAGTQRGETEGGNQDQKGQASFPTPESSVGVGPLQGLASASVASGSQSGRGRVAPVSPRRQQRGPLSCKMPPGEKASRGDAESPDAPLPPPVPTAAFHNSLIPQHPEHPAPPASSLSFPGTPIPKARQKGIPKALETPLSSEMEPIHPKSKVRSRGSSRVASSPGSSTALEPQHLNPSDQPVTPKSTSWATQGRTHRSSVRTLEPAESVAPDHQHSTSKDELVTSKPTSRATRGRTRRSSVKIHESGESTASEGHTSTSIDLPVTTKPTSRITRSRTQRSSVKTPRPVESTVSEGPPSTSTKQPVTPTQAAQGRTRRSSVKTSEPIEPTASEVQPSTSTNQSVTPEPKSLVTLGRTRRSSVKAPESPVSTDPTSMLPLSSYLSVVGLLEAPPQSPKIENIKVEEEKSDFTSDPQSKPSPSHKRSEATIKSPPPQKRPKRGQVPQNTESFKEEDTAEMPEKKENVENPGPGKRKRDQMEEEPKAAQSRNLRRSKPNQESTAPKVLFTGVVDARGERAVLALGGSMAASVTEASHLVTDRIRRTVKFLCALGRGIPILTLDWLHQSRKAGCFLPPDEYVVTDPEQEKNFGFSLQDALSRAQKQRLLEGYEIHVTPGVQPPPPQMGEIISCCGGTVLPNMPRSYKPRRVVITCSQDFPRCSIPLRVGLPLVSSEFLLTGVLKQEANPEAFILSTLEMSSP
ncbi:mediator of DNA damage checkpoint protein 1 [Rhynchocyon petersi]